MRFATILVVLLFGCSLASTQEPVPVGVWGGKGIQLTVTPNGAGVDYGCDSGTIDEILKRDASGRFSARGTHVFGRGGPRKPGDPDSKSHQARYEGVQTGDKLVITIVLPELDRNVGRFTLRLDERPSLERCG